MAASLYTHTRSSALDKEMGTYVSIYIYIYIEREMYRERDVSIHVYMYIYTYDVLYHISLC